MNMRQYLICIAASCFVLAGCNGRQAAPVPGGGSLQSGHIIKPDVVQNGHTPVQWTQFPWGDTNLPNQVNGIVTGSDKNVWYTDYNGHALIKMQMTGKTSLFPLTFGTNTNFYPGNLTVGSDGKFYIGAYGNPGFIGVATTSGSFSVKTIPSGDYSADGRLVLGPDGNVWFTEQAHVAKITTSGTVTEFPYPDGFASNTYGSIVAGSDGDLWVSEYSQNVIDDVDPSDGSIAQYPLPCSPTGLVSAKDGNVWAACSNNTLLRISTSGSYNVVANPLGTDGYPSSFTLGADGNPWFTTANHNMIGEFNIAKNTLSVFFPPTAQGNSYALTAGPDGNMWAFDSLGNTDIYILNPLGVAPSSITFHVGNTQTLTVTEKGTTAWTATSTNPGVASVAQGSPANKFVVTANGLGNTTITVKDAVGNSFAIKVKVD
jgi:virginiamycin B lyase